ncbi:MAG: Acylphosphatase [Syntrophorhabdus sp. PtaU1.Bin002]|nr:MAG: Acylphosphatase [Syntrophorhabdus sp. PtaB.Bin006]OPY72673.1 MAG: Acylphosphatase [Syntrophorhabdus sp. PtaU1.Bin002]
MMIRAHMLVSGVVQGVFFRHNTMKKANEFDVTGWVRNLHDGRVEIVCEGKKDEVQKLADWCKKGPIGAYVSNVDMTWEDYTGEFDTFQITY